MTLTGEVPSSSRTQALKDLEAWATSTVRCVLVPRGQQIDVELQNAQGIAFLRKSTPSPQSARNEAAVLRLFLEERRRRSPADGVLKPFVLIGEEDANRREGCAEVMRGSSMRVLAVGTGRDALAFARELTPDLMLITDRLPDLSGGALCAELRAGSTTASIPVVLIADSPDSIREGDDAGPDVVLGRPCAFETILATARLLLASMLPLSESDGAQVR